jgi:hypothetical protein
VLELWLAIVFCLAAAAFGPPAEGATPATQHIAIGMTANTSFTVTRLDDSYTLTTESDGQGIVSFEIPAGNDPAPDTVQITTGTGRLENRGCAARRKDE